MKKFSFICLLLCLTACGNTKGEIKETTGSYTNQKNEVTSANIKWQDGKITEIELDETTGDTTKKSKGEAYGMKVASSIGKEWNQQAMFFEKYVQDNGYENIQMDDEGKATNEDVLTGCTISIDGFMKAIEDAKSKLE